MNEYLIEPMMLASLPVWVVRHPSLTPLGRRYFWTREDAERFVTRVTA